MQTLYGVMVIALASLDLYIILKQYSKKLICFYVLGLSIQLLGMQCHTVASNKMVIKKWNGQNEQKSCFFKKKSYSMFFFSLWFRDENLYSTYCKYFLIFDWFLKGTFLWIVDNLACDQLEQVREILPKIISPILQLHGWWHIFAGYATYMHIIFCVCQVSNCVLVCTYLIM